jgi:hypothetical protein
VAGIAAACSATVAPEATYQAWFAHFLIQRFGLLRVVREVDFGARHLDEQARARFRGANLMLDVMVLHEPIVNSTQAQGLRYGTILQDVLKLEAIFRGAKSKAPDVRLPDAFVCVLDNHSSRPLNVAYLQRAIDAAASVRAMRVLVHTQEGTIEL